jgi:D-alanyl-lipoteichoic acid acyltransferase DltB (MBOAT superfamily)
LGFDSATSLNLFEAWATSLSYTFQLYFDFSGYTDMAIGAALLFNIVLPINFNSPYKAKDIQDFWRRWHITLSRFLRDYIYIPLGGNRVSEFRVQTNLMITFLVGGLWHGAGWTFVFWGFLHGSALIAHRVWNNLGFKMNSILAWFVTFNFINITWVFFRATKWDDALKVLEGMFGFSGIMLPQKFASSLVFLSDYGVEFGNVFIDIGNRSKTLTYIIAALIIVIFFKNSMQLRESFKTNYKTLLFSLALLFIAISMMSNISEFLYFNF